jgi:hypothetical protein
MQAPKSNDFDVEGMDVDAFFDETEAHEEDDAESEKLREHLMKIMKGAGNPTADDDDDDEDVEMDEDGECTTTCKCSKAGLQLALLHL